MSDKLLLTVSEASERLGIGRSHFYELLRSGEILSVRLGRSRRVPLKALEEFAEAKIAEARAEDVSYASPPSIGPAASR